MALGIEKEYNWQLNDAVWFPLAFSANCEFIASFWEDLLFWSYHDEVTWGRVWYSDENAFKWQSCENNSLDSI